MSLLTFYFLFRTAFTYLSGILTFVVAWVILGKGSKSQLSANSSKEFMVKYLVEILFHMVASKYPISL